MNLRSKLTLEICQKVGSSGEKKKKEKKRKRKIVPKLLFCHPNLKNIAVFIEKR